MEVYSFGPENLIGSKKFCFMGRAHKTLLLSPLIALAIKSLNGGCFPPAKPIKLDAQILKIQLIKNYRSSQIIV